MKKKLFFVLGLLMAVVVQAQTYWNGTSNKVFSGSGTQTDPYLIGTAEQLAGLAERTNVDKENFAGQYIKLTADIYLTNFNDPDTAGWLQWEPIAHELIQWEQPTDHGSFRGHFDGDGHTIYNMYYGAGMDWASDWDPNDWDIDPGMYDYSVMNKALFGNLEEGAIVENLTIANAKLCAVNQAILAVTVNEGATVRNCHVSGDERATGSNMAGLVYTNKGLIENSSANVSIAIKGGGCFVQQNELSGVIRNCSATGTMTHGGGGFVNANYGLIERCTADVDIYGASVKGNNGKTSWSSAAGFALGNGGIIRECAAYGDMYGYGTSANYLWLSAIAGFCYRNWDGVIESSYCTGTLHNARTDDADAPRIAHFCYTNGEDAVHYNDDRERGDILNCYSTSMIDDAFAASHAGCLHGFIGDWHGEGGFYANEVLPSRQAFCYFANESMPAISEQSDANWYGSGESLAYMQSQAFVDTLNMVASIFGWSQWELQNGLPRPTGVRTRNSSVFLAGGEGTKENPYLISNKTQLENFRWLVQHGYDFHDEFIKQTADIALNAPMSEWEFQMPEQWKPIASPLSHPAFSKEPETVFYGTYDGDFHEIKNMYIDNNLPCQGLFRNIGHSFDGFTVSPSLRNLRVTDALITAGDHAGILAGRAGNNFILSQCYTSGQMSPASPGNGVGALIGTDSNYKWWLNCSSSAHISGQNYSGWINKGSIVGDQIWLAFSNDTLINYLFTGTLNDVESGSSFQRAAYSENAFEDGTIANRTYDGHNPNGVVPTEYLQSKEFVNLLNASVARWNASHDEELQIDYWEWQEGNYPKLTKNPSYTPAIVTFESNGGTAIVSRQVVPGSRIEMPVRPLKDGQLFSGWYKDAALTQIFDFYNDIVENDMTLYARWINDDRYDADFTPFSNKFTSTYHIQTAAQLRAFAQLQNGIYDWSSGSIEQVAAPRDFTGKTIVLDNDILLCDTTDWQYWGRGAYGLPWKSIGSETGYLDQSRYTVAFNGTFDGQGHVIYGLYAELGGMRGTEMGGLFCWTGSDAVIQNVGIEASVIDAQVHNTKGQAGGHTWYFESNQKTDHLGMLANDASGAIIKQCYAVGRMYTALTGWGGGFLCYASDSVINCYARIDIYQDNMEQRDSLEQSGAFSPSNNCKSRMVNCYSAGRTKQGGVSGTSYYDQDLASNPGTENSARSSFSLKTISNYVGWDFENVWGRNDDINDGYPVLRLFHPDIENSPDPIRVTGITVEPTTGSIYVGESFQFNASVLPENATNKKINWKMTTTYKYATIDQTGLVTTVDTTISDVAYITVSSDDGNFTKKCTLSIRTPTVAVNAPIYSRRIGDTTWISGFVTNTSNTRFSRNWEYIVFASTTPAEKHKPVIWSTSDASIITVEPLVDDTTYTYTSTGRTYRGAMAIVRCLGNGAFTLTATCAEGSPHKGTSKQWVVQYEMTGISLNSSLSMNIDETYQLKPTLTPRYTSYEPTYSWSSDNESVATVENGMVQAVGVGTATITVSAEGYSATCVVTVTNPQPTYYTIRFLNYNGAVLQNSQVLEGDMPSYTGATPIKPADSEYTYSFNGWSPAIVAATANADYTAQFTATAKPQGGSDCDPYVCDFTKKSANHTAYTDSWVYDNDWTVFGGANNGGQWDYVKMGGKNTNIANANPVYVVNKSAFDCEIASVKVTFPAGSFSKSGMSCNNWGVKVYSDLACNNLLYTVNGGTISKNAETLTVTPAAGQTWSAGYAIQVYWDLANTSTTNGIVLVSKIEYIPAASSTPVDPTYYTIRFLNWDDTELQNTLVLEGTMPSYTGSTPTKPADDEYTYSFNGWSPTIVAATADADYTAQFTATTKPQGGGDDCENVQATWLQTGGSDLEEMTTDDATVWTYNAQYGAVGKKQGGATGWLLTPANNLSGMESVTLTFSHAHRYATNFADEMTLWVTPDYKGSVTASQWEQLTISPYAANTNWNFVDVTVNVPTSAVGDNTVFGFKYMSTASGYATWEIKNLTLNAQCNNTPTDIQNVSDRANNVARKVLINGQLFILRDDGTIFDARGVRVK